MRALLSSAAAALIFTASAEGAGVADGPRPIFGPYAPQQITERTGGWLGVSTAPSSRAANSVGINLDTWSRSGAYTHERWPNLMSKLRGSGITKARVDVHLVSGDWGTQRQIEMGKAGFKLDVQLGDAFGRYSAGPLDAVFNVFKTHLLPYSEAVEGTNEPDLAGPTDWATTAIAHQKGIVERLATTPGTEQIAVFAPPSARPNNQSWFGNLSGLADYANAHAYSGGRPGSAGFDSFLPPAQKVLPNGATVVTETGVHTATEGTYKQPGVAEDVAARYTPKIALEAIRRGIPRTYLFDLVDRFDDPQKNRVEAHFGLLNVDGTPKPTYAAISRLMAELRDPKGKPAIKTADLALKPRQALPADVRIVALRRSDGSVTLAIWRERSLWDIATGTPVAAPTARVRLALREQYLLGKVQNVASGKTSWQLPFLQGLDLSVGDDVTLVRLSHRLR